MPEEVNDEVGGMVGFFLGGGRGSFAAKGKFVSITVHRKEKLISITIIFKS